MRYQGRIGEWKDDRGFGFIAPNGGGARVFVHISSFSTRGHRPSIGSLVTYELVMDDKGRPQAKSAQFVGDRGRTGIAEPNRVVAALAAIFILCFGGYVAYVRMSQPNSTVSASAYKIFSARDALRSHPEFRCDPAKSSCSRMTSCAEAFFHQERCGVSGMDGDGDGIPCEQQWCN
jgi:cold shock CspA family protein